MKTPLAGLILLAVLPAWAVEVTGVPNFHQVNAHICRGGQPSTEGWNNLARLGVKTVVDLRPAGEHSIQAERSAVEAAGMRYVNVPLSGFGAPSDAGIRQVLSLLGEPASGTVFVHCRRGADRTGTVIACYRISCDRWENQKALDEAKSLGMSRLEFAMRRYVMHFEAPALTLP